MVDRDDTQSRAFSPYLEEEFLSPEHAEKSSRRFLSFRLPESPFESEALAEIESSGSRLSSPDPEAEVTHSDIGGTSAEADLLDEKLDAFFTLEPPEELQEPEREAEALGKDADQISEALSDLAELVPEEWSAVNESLGNASMSPRTNSFADEDEQADEEYFPWGEADPFDEEASTDLGDGLQEAFEEEADDERMLEAFRPREIDEQAAEDDFQEAQVGSSGRSRDFKLELELSYGMERAVGGAPQGPANLLPDDTVVTTHTKSSDGFEVVMDGPRMEVETRRIGLQEPAELDRIMTNILRFARDLRRACGEQEPRAVPGSNHFGKVRAFRLSSFSSPDFIAFPIKDSGKQRTWFRQSCRIGASPQCTIDVPLESVLSFVDELRRSQRRGRSSRWTGRSGARAGLRSDAIFHARDAVIKSFRAHSAAGQATNSQLTLRLAGFTILLVQYLRTSELRYHKADRPSDPTFTKPDSGSDDHEQFPKAYVPLVVHTHFHVLFDKILSSAERALFRRLYGDPSVRQNLFDLALDAPGSKSGSAELFPARTRGIQIREFGSVLTWDQFIDSAIDASKPIRDASGNLSLPTPLATASKGVAKTGPARARVDGVRLEMRRMGYRWWRPDEWKSMSNHLYMMARSLNRIS